jgi:hypothetical protein
MISVKTDPAFAARELSSAFDAPGRAAVDAAEA